jgi:plasmid maintenance system antidote protein VapI
MSDSLLKQLSNRVQAFIAATGISQRKLAKLIKTDETHLSAFLAGKSGLSAEKSLRLMQILNSSRSQLEMKLGRSTTAAQIAHFQQEGQMMRLDSNGGWVAREGGNGDPNGTTDITNTWKSGGAPSDDPIIDVLRQVDNYHRQAREAIAAWFATAAQAKVNKAGSTEPARRISDNDKSSHPGSRGDAFSTAKRKEYLQYLEKQRRESEEALQLEERIKREQERAWDARVELVKFKQKR